MMVGVGVGRKSLISYWILSVPTLCHRWRHNQPRPRNENKNLLLFFLFLKLVFKCDRENLLAFLISVFPSRLCVSDSSVGGQPCYWSAFFSLSSFFFLLLQLLPYPIANTHTHTHTYPFIFRFSISLIALYFFFFFLAKEIRRISFGTTNGGQLFCECLI